MGRRTASYSRKVQIKEYSPDEFFASAGWDELDTASPEDRAKRYDEKFEECRQDVHRQIAKFVEDKSSQKTPTNEETKKKTSADPKGEESPKATPPQRNLIEMLVKRVKSNSDIVANFLKDERKAFLSELTSREASALIELLKKPAGWQEKEAK